MPDLALIDTHLHLWDPEILRYPWLDANASLNRPHLLDDYRAATQGVGVEAMVFVQCEAQVDQSEQEAAWVASLAKSDPRIRGLVAWAPLEKGTAVAGDLERLMQHDILRGVRRIIQFEPDLDFCLRPGFIEGLRTLDRFDLSFDICVDHRHLANVIRLVEQAPEVKMVLDHIGKPAIRDGLMQPWADQLRTLANFPNVACKVSGVATEADHADWRADQLRPYIETAIAAFGFDRIMFGGDWPVSTQAIDYRRWVNVLEDVLSDASADEQRRFWRDNAARFYRL